MYVKISVCRMENSLYNLRSNHWQIIVQNIIQRLQKLTNRSYYYSCKEVTIYIKIKVSAIISQMVQF